MLSFGPLDDAINSSGDASLTLQRRSWLFRSAFDLILDELHLEDEV